MEQQPVDIIIVDDNRDISMMMESILQFAGYRARGCNNHEQLLQLLSVTAPRLILMDMILAGMDGRDICKNLKSTEATRLIPVMMISAHPDAELTCVEAGADAFLEKPFEIDVFLEKTAHFMRS